MVGPGLFRMSFCHLNNSEGWKAHDLLFSVACMNALCKLRASEPEL